MVPIAATHSMSMTAVYTLDLGFSPDGGAAPCRPGGTPAEP
jgi:hypothetical protein